MEITQRKQLVGTFNNRQQDIPFALSIPDRLLHTYVIGQTGTGKSTLLANLMRQDIDNGVGFCLIDPHGDLAEEIASAGDNVTLWSPADPTCKVGYNPLAHVAREFRPLIASGIIDALKQQWADAWGARMEHLLRFSLLALLDRPNSSLADVIPMFLDKDFRATVLPFVGDQLVSDFWLKEFSAMNYKTAVDGVAPIANKIGAFLAHPLVRKSVCSPDDPLRLRRVMDEGGHLAINLAKGRLGADTSNVLGGLIVASIANAAYSRQGIPERSRRPFFLYVDEFHSFSTAALVGMLSELRKYGLGLILAHQHTAQLDHEILEAILGNAGTIISFRLGATDAQVFAIQFGTLEARDFTNLPNYEIYIRMMIEGHRCQAFSAKTFPPNKLS
jgi:type IV secretory pathway TraG/TraD family ATPase VirD4